MRIVQFKRPDMSRGWGLQTGFGIQDLTQADPTLPLNTLELIQRWSELLPRIQGLAKRLGASDQALTPICPITNPQKILCIGLNYRDHAVESGMPIPEEPIVFCKMPTSLVGPDDPIVLPKVSTKVDYEAELVVVIGRRMKNVNEAEAASGIFGYTVGHDVSARDWQLEKAGKQWFLGKTFDSFAPIGPSITIAEMVKDVRNLKVQLRLNGETMQNSSTRELIFAPVQLIVYLSQIMTLEVGDLIFTGTPPGVGMARKPPRYLQAGDQVEVEIESLGVLRNGCVAE